MRFRPLTGFLLTLSTALMLSAATPADALSRDLKKFPARLFDKGDTKTEPKTDTKPEKPEVKNSTGDDLGGDAAKEADNDDSDLSQSLALFAEVFQKVRSDYVEETSNQKLVETALNGMLTSLDPHSSYLTQDDFKDMQTQTKGEFGGLGLEVTMENNAVKVVSPIDDTPAAKAQIQPNDFIIQIDGKPIMGLTLNEAVQKLRGAPKSKVKLTIVRGKGEPFDKELVRDIIKIQSVRWKAIDNVGYIRITQFNERTSPGLDDAFTALQKQLGDKMIGMVLDLRNNPGGLLDQSIAVSNAFLSKGDIVSTRGRHKEDNQVWTARPELAKAPDKPMVVLVNSGSASASEIVAGALQDNKRALVMGVKSFGKGSVQTVMPIPGHGALRMTTARYFTPSGHSIQAKGIVPDIEVKQAKLEEIAQKGLLLSERDLKGALSNPDDDNAPKVTAAPEALPEVPETVAAVKDGNKDKKSQVAEPFDYQLARAIDLLRGLSIYSKD